MRRPADFFDDREVELIHIASTLRGALKLERLLDEKGVDYAVETGEYVGGLLFRTTRTGAFFYVAAAEADACRELLERHRFNAIKE